MSGEDKNLGALGKGVAAVVIGFAAIALIVVLIDLRHDSPKAHEPSAAARPTPLATPGSRSSPARHSATGSPTSTSPRTGVASPSSTDLPHPRRSTSSTVVLPSRSSPPSSRPRSSTATPTPTPSPVQRVVSIPISDNPAAGTVTITMPSGWTITHVSVPGTVLLTSGDGVHSGTWQVVGSPMSVTVAGLSGDVGSMHVHVRTASGSSDRYYQLS